MKPFVPLSVSLRNRFFPNGYYSIFLWLMEKAARFPVLPNLGLVNAGHNKPTSREFHKLYMREYLLHALNQELSVKQAGALYAFRAH
jgi:hypothetical protein